MLASALIYVPEISIKDKILNYLGLDTEDCPDFIGGYPGIEAEEDQA